MPHDGPVDPAFDIFGGAQDVDSDTDQDDHRDAPTRALTIKMPGGVALELQLGNGPAETQENALETAFQQARNMLKDPTAEQTTQHPQAAKHCACCNKWLNSDLQYQDHMIGKNHNKMMLAAAKQKKSTSSASNKQPALPTDGGSKQPKQKKSTSSDSNKLPAIPEDEPEPPPPPLQPQPPPGSWAKPWVEAAHRHQTQMGRQQQAAFQHAQQFGAAYGAEHGSMEDQALMLQQQQMWQQQPWDGQGLPDGGWGFYASC